jgi:hypothetical protein
LIAAILTLQHILHAYQQLRPIDLAKVLFCSVVPNFSIFDFPCDDSIRSPPTSLYNNQMLLFLTLILEISVDNKMFRIDKIVNKVVATHDKQKFELQNDKTIEIVN